MSEQKKMKWWDRFGPRLIDRRILFWMMTAVIVIIYIRPIGLPIPIQTRVRTGYEEIEKLPKDTIVILDISCTWGTWPECHPLAYCALKHFIQKDLRVVVTGFHVADSSSLMIDTFEKVGIPEDWEYGVDYLAIGYIPGREAAVAGLATDVHSLIKTDYYGNNIVDLPLGREINNAESFALVCSLDTGGITDMWLRHWVTPYGIPYIHMSSSGGEVGDAPYYPEFIKGTFAGINGGAAYETLTGFLGDAVKSTDMLSGTHILIIIAIIVGNIFYLVERSVK